MKTRDRFVLALLFAVLTVVPASAQEAEGGAAPETEAAADDVLAYIGDEAITTAQIDRLIGNELAKLEQQAFDLRMQALQQVITQKLVEKEAEAQSINPGDLFRAEVLDKVVAPTDEEIEDFYQQAKNDARFEGRTEEQVKKRIRAGLEQQKADERRDMFLADLRSKTEVRVLMEPPRSEVPLPAGEPSLGSSDAPVTIVEFADYQCGFCKRVQPAVDKLLAEYGDKVYFVYRDYPLDFHPRAAPAANAARCAGDQGKFWEYHTNLMTGAGGLEDADLMKRAETLELDMAAFSGCYESKRHQEAIMAAFQDGAGLGVTGTPTFFINGRIMVGAQPYDALQAVIEDELRRAEQPSE